MLVRAIRTKLVAVLLGPSGVGLVGLYQSILEMVSTASGLGINSSGVRQVAEAVGSEDATRIARTAKVLSLACWITGLVGCAVCAVAAVPISKWVFGGADRAWTVAALGIVLLIDSIAKGQAALLRGTRHIRELAIIQIVSALGSTLLSAGIYGGLGERGILPVLLTSSLVVLLVTTWFRRRIKLVTVEVARDAVFAEGRRLVSLGLAFTWSAVVGAVVAFAIRTMVTRQDGLDANGIYQAAWGLSGLFGSFILSAMGLDFYPRLTAAAAKSDEEVNRLVNEQTEVGLLLALPGLMATFALGPWLIPLFYSAKFVIASQLLPWFVLGVYGQVLSWPAGFIQLAKGASGNFAITQTTYHLTLLLFTVLFLRIFGLVGVAVAFAVAYGILVLLTLVIAARLTHFRWDQSVRRLVGVSTLLVFCMFLILQFFSPLTTLMLGLVLSVTTGLYCLRSLCSRLGPANRIHRAVYAIPVVGKRLVPYLQP